QPALRIAERNHAIVRAVDPLPQLLDAHGDAVAPALEPAREPVHDVSQPGREYHRDQHDDAQDAEDREAGAKQTVIRDPKDDIVPFEGLAGAEVDGEWSRAGEEDYRRDERHERGRHRFGEAYPRPAHHPHHGGPRTGLERGQVGRPGAHASGDDHVLQPHARLYVASDDPQPRPSADPVHRGEAQSYHHPSPVEVQQSARDSLDVLAIHDEDNDDTGQGDDGEEFKAATEQARSEGESAWGGRLRKPGDGW